MTNVDLGRLTDDQTRELAREVFQTIDDDTLRTVIVDHYREVGDKGGEISELVIALEEVRDV